MKLSILLLQIGNSYNWLIIYKQWTQYELRSSICELRYLKMNKVAKFSQAATATFKRMERN